MGLFFGILSFENGFVIVSDINSNAAETSHVIKINEHNVVALANDLEYGKKFCEHFLLGKISEEIGINEIVEMATTAINNHKKEYEGKILTMHFLGFDSKLQQNLLHSIFFNGKEVIYNAPSPSNQKTLFTFEVNLGTFIVNKVYSNYMSTNQAIRLMGYVASQYRILYSNHIGKSIVMHVISETGVKLLDDDEIKKTLEDAENADMQIRKDCSDLFITNDLGNKK